MNGVRVRMPPTSETGVMNTVKGTWKNGQVVLDSPTDWPDGCRVLVEPAPEGVTIGIREEDWPTTPQAIADWLQWYDSLEPIEITPEEEANLAAWRQQVKAYSIAKQSERIQGLFE
jgi:hypothetical protein